MISKAKSFIVHSMIRQKVSQWLGPRIARPANIATADVRQMLRSLSDQTPYPLPNVEAEPRVHDFHLDKRFDHAIGTSPANFAWNTIVGRPCARLVNRVLSIGVTAYLIESLRQRYALPEKNSSLRQRVLARSRARARYGCKIALRVRVFAELLGGATPHPLFPQRTEISWLRPLVTRRRQSARS